MRVPRGGRVGLGPRLSDPSILLFSPRTCRPSRVPSCCHLRVRRHVGYTESAAGELGALVERCDGARCVWWFSNRPGQPIQLGSQAPDHASSHHRRDRRL